MQRGRVLAAVAARVVFTFAVLVLAGCTGSGDQQEHAGVTSQALSTVAVRTLGFESLQDWSPLWSNVTLGISSVHSEGQSSLALRGGGWMQVQSRPLSKESPAPSVIGYDLRVPTNTANPWWQGSTELSVDAPSAGIWGQYIGHAELKNLSPGQFVRVEFPVPADLRTKLGANYTDLKFRVVVNVPEGETAEYLVDRFTFGPATPVCTPTSDGNPCTEDVCINGVPAWQPRAVGSNCDSDGTVCNGSATCSSAATCVTAPPPTVDDGNPCTADACDPTNGVVHLPVAAGLSCETDADACNGVSRCNTDGACMPGAAPTVDDGNPCTSDSCDAAQGVRHVALAAGTNCDADANSCNGGGSCDGNGACVATPPPLLDDGNPCTRDSCDATNGVRHLAVANGGACTDSNACTVGDTCQAGVCVAGAPRICVAIDQCHSAGACEPATGVCSSPARVDGAACSDGNACTQVDSCQSGACVGASPVACAAVDACHVAGTCDAATGGCSNPVKADGAACDDATVCNGREVCSGGTCVAGTAADLDDHNPCTSDSCDAVAGAVHAAVENGSACDDGNACTQADACLNGACQGSSPVVCAAVDLCHLPGTCDPSSGVCSNPVRADGDACDDASVCNGRESCQAGRCIGATAPTLDDGNPCTADACDATTGVTHTPVGNGTSCETDGDLCNGVSTCQSGFCAGGSAPTLSDGNPCTEDACTPSSGVTHTPLAAGASCSDGDACNGDERCDLTGACVDGTPLSIDDGDACTEDDCDPVLGPIHDPIAGCGPTTVGPGKPFETRASILGRVVKPDGSPVTAFQVDVFNERLDSEPRTDLLTDVGMDGGFRARLTEFPQTVPERSPASRVILRVTGAEFPTIYRTLYVRPGDAASVGDLTVLLRDPQVTVIGPAGGTAQSSNGAFELQVPPGALAAPTPVRITPIPERRLFPTPLPDSTITMYGVELEPEGTTFAAPAKLRIRNNLNLPTTMEIPMGYVDAKYGDWQDEGFAVWDGSRFSANIAHFSTHDANGARQGELVWVGTPGTDPNAAKRKLCVGSSAGPANGGLTESLDLPGYSAAGLDHIVTLNFNGALSGSVSLGKALSEPHPPGGRLPIVQSFAAPSMHLECASPGGGGSQAGCGTGVACSLGSGGVALPTPITRKVQAFGKEVSSTLTLPAGGTSDDVLVNAELPLDENGVPVRSAYHPISSAIGAQGGSSCAVAGAGFGVASPGLALGGGFKRGNATRVTGDQAPLADFPSYQLIYHRRGSPVGSGWAIEQAKSVYRTPDRLSGDIVDGTGARETFRPYPQVTRLGSSLIDATATAVDAQSGQAFVATATQGISAIAPDTGALSTVAPTARFGGGSAISLKVTRVQGEQRFLAATRRALFEINAAGQERQLLAFANVLNDSTRFAGVAGVGRYAYFTEDLRAKDAVTMVDAVAVRRIDLTNPGATAEDITASSGGDLRLDPHGEVVAAGFQFLHPRGLAAALDGGLYVADDRRHAVYHLAPDSSGQVGPSSVVTRVLGSGSDTAVTGIGQSFPGLVMPLRAPGELAVAPDGTLFVTTSDWSLNFAAVVAFDPIADSAHTVTLDKTSRQKQMELGVQGASLAPLTGDTALVAYNSAVYRLATPLSSEFEPTRTLTFSETGATVVDTLADSIEQYGWVSGAATEGHLIALRQRSGELLRSIAYVDADRIDFIADAHGGRTRFVYDASGRLSEIHDAAERVTRLTVDDAGDLREVVYPDGQARRFTYEDHRLVSATHPDGGTAHYTYSEDGTLLTATRPSGGTTTMKPALAGGPHYDATGRLYYEATVTDPRGVVHTYETNFAGDLVSDTYTADGVTYAVKNNYASSLVGVDANESMPNRLLRFASTQVNGLLVTPITTWDPMGRPISSAQTTSSSTEIGRVGFDNNGRLGSRGFGGVGVNWTYSYDSTGHLSRLADTFVPSTGKSGETGRFISLADFRPSDGQPASVTQHGITTAFDFDARGNVLTATNTLGNTVATTYDAAGNPLHVANDITSVDYTYDAAGRATSAMDIDGNATVMQYQDEGCACSKGGQLRTLVTPDLQPGQAWHFDYDTDGHPQTITTPLGETEHFAYNAQRDLVSVTDRLGRSQSFTYDQLGRPQTTTDSAGRLGAFAYSQPTAGGWAGPTIYAQSSTSSPAPTGLTAKLADGQYQVGTNGMAAGADASHIELYRDPTFQLSFWHQADVLGRETWRGDRNNLPFDSAEPGPTKHGGSAFTSENSTYAFFGSPAPLAQGFETLDKYGGGRFFSATSKRNAEFELTDITDVLGDSKFAGSTISRDVAGRVTGIKNRYRGELWQRDTRPGAKDEDVVFFQGPTSSFITYKPNGQVDSIGGHLISQTFGYDNRGLVSERTVEFTQVGGEEPHSIDAGTFRYSYDAAGRNTRLIYPEGYERQQQFDALGRLTSRCYVYSTPFPDRCYAATYDAVGNPKVLTDPEMRREIEYDNLDRVTEVRRYVPPDSTTPAYTERYAYNALGGFSVYDNVTLEDRRPRLDGTGTASAGLPATYNGAPLNLDAAGRVSALGNNSFHYFGAENRLQAIGAGGGEVRFAYDPLGRSVGTAGYGSSSVAATRTGALAYLYNGLEDNVAAFDSSGLNSNGLERNDTRPSRVFIYDGTDHPLWQVDTHYGRTFYYELDTLGNVRRLRTSQDARSGVRRPEDDGGYAYTAFGRTLSASEPGGSQGVTVRGAPYSEQPYRWQGRIYLGNNLYDFRARVWSTELGSFLQPDQYAFLTRSGTLWSWPGNNPFRWRDPSGRERTAGDYFMQYADTAIDTALGVSGVAFTIATLGAGAEVGLALAEGRLALAAAGRLALAGAAKGAILGGGLETGRQLLTKPKCRGLDGGLIADAAFAGAVSGALFGARGGIAAAAKAAPVAEQATGLVFHTGGEAAQRAAAAYAEGTGGKVLGEIPADKVVDASRAFAESARGTVDVFVGNVNPKSVWYSIERPMLQSNSVDIRVHLPVLQGTP